MAGGTTKLKEAIGDLGRTTKDLGGNVADAVKTTFDTTRGTGGKIGDAMLFPVRMGVKVARWPVAAANGAFKKFPVFSVVSTALVAGLGVRGWLRGRAEQRTQDEMNASIAGVPNPAPSAPLYQATPEEAALMEARMRGGNGVPRTGHADSVIAAKQQVAAAGTPAL